MAKTSTKPNRPGKEAPKRSEEKKWRVLDDSADRARRANLYQARPYFSAGGYAILFGLEKLLLPDVSFAGRLDIHLVSGLMSSKANV
jgi:hypothetical protein